LYELFSLVAGKQYDSQVVFMLLCSAIYFLFLWKEYFVQDS